MPLPQAFFKDLPEKSDEQLYDILGHLDNYVPEAIEAVRGELLRRDLPPERAAKLEAMSQQKTADEQQRSDASLGWIVRIVMFISSVTLILAMVGLAIVPARYESQGYRKKARQCWTCWGLGLCFWILLAIVILVLR